ncbi:hypothetical protein AB4Y87_11440 [Paenarthrobacter sp. RAF54_2]|uniref:hypothetical protein n=1 Tax=Paenarthrobacter sp. RAF54_2 TaxID=3233061 RepID=UPI003F988C3B
MDILAVLVAVLAAPALIAALWFWVSRQNSKGKVRRGAAGGILGVTDEIFRPETHYAHQIQRIQLELPAPAPAPEPKS